MRPTDTPFALSETDRRVGNLLLIGTVEQADYGAARVRVRSGEQLTTWVPWLTRRASNDCEWWAPEVGEQVLLACPAGDPAQAVVLGALYQHAHPQPASHPNVHRTTYADGTTIEYDRERHHLVITSVGQVTLNASERVTINAPQIDLNEG